MANPKWLFWTEPENRERVINWAANGLTNEEIARSMGVHRATLQRWIVDHSDIRDAIKYGRTLACEAVENALFRKATGSSVVEETVEEFKGEMQDGKPVDGTVTRKTVRRTMPPDTAAIIFYLKNRMPDKYSDRRTMEVEAAVPTVVLGIEPRRADG